MQYRIERKFFLDKIISLEEMHHYCHLNPKNDPILNRSLFDLYFIDCNTTLKLSGIFNLWLHVKHMTIAIRAQ